VSVDANRGKKSWHATHRERRNAWMRRWQGTSPAYKRWRVANREHNAEIKRIWRKRSPKYKAWVAKNRAKRAAQALEHYYRQRNTLVEYQRDYNVRVPRRAALVIKWDRCQRLCYICGEVIETPSMIHADHVIPVTRGGTNDIENLMPTHRRCNVAKGNKLNYPVARPDLIERVKDVVAYPRRKAA
jgi:5-methylcytosine-specific restriction endonuclease McrA